MATMVEPAMPLGFDTGLDDIQETYLSRKYRESITSNASFENMLEYYELDSPRDTYSLIAASDTARSSGLQSQPNNSTAGLSSSLSPNTSLILTPASTLHDDFNGDPSLLETPDDSDLVSSNVDDSASPNSDGYVHVHFTGPAGSSEGNMSAHNPYPASFGNGSASPHPPTGPSTVRNHSTDTSQWSSANALFTGAWTNGPPSGQLGQLSVPAKHSFDNDSSQSSIEYESNIPSTFTSFDGGGHNSFGVNPSFQYSDDGNPNVQSQYEPYVAPATASQLQLQDPEIQYQQQVVYPIRPGPVQQQVPRLLEASTSIFSRQEWIAKLPGLGHSHLQPQWQASTAALPSNTNITLVHTAQSHAPTYPDLQTYNYPTGPTPPFAVTPPARPVQPAALSSHQRIVPSQLHHPSRKGGRQRGKHLKELTRNESHQMRKTGACWRCAMQRDKCSDGSPCKRCVETVQKGQIMYFPCDRSKLPELMQDFLPYSMSSIHQKESILSCVRDQVLQWDQTNSVDVSLTCGYGPPLTWKLYEFKPRTAELVGQYQYFQDVTTGATVRYQKYAPPFGLLKLDGIDEAHFDSYLDVLLHRDYLWDFGWTCFEEETQIDDFQARLLDLLCKLYTATEDTDYDLSQILRKLLKLLLLTYIISHALTLPDSPSPSTPNLLHHIRHSPHPTHPTPQTSPKLATRQLKSFFCALRTQITETLLNWHQQTLHASAPKHQTWLPAFCVMLTFAMVLEEIQRTLYLQADAKVEKGEMEGPRAETEAKRACERIDERFGMLVGLFQCKFRDRRWGSSGSFGNQTPEIRGRSGHEFCRGVLGLVREKEYHLASRRDVPLAAEYQCQFTSRLVARFLLPFLGLPA